MDSLGRLMSFILLLLIIIAPVSSDVTESREISTAGETSLSYSLNSTFAIVNLSWLVESENTTTLFSIQICVISETRDCTSLYPFDKVRGSEQYDISGDEVIIEITVDSPQAVDYNLILEIEIREKSLLTPFLVGSLPILVITLVFLNIERKQ